MVQSGDYGWWQEFRARHNFRSTLRLLCGFFRQVKNYSKFSFKNLKIYIYLDFDFFFRLYRHI